MNSTIAFPWRILTVLCVSIYMITPAALAGEVTLEDNQIVVAFDSQSGALTRLEDKTTHWVIERRPELGVSFRLFAPLPDRRYNPILGQKQQAAEVKKISANALRIQWANLVSENGGVLPMTLTANVTLTNGTLTFAATLQNDSPLTVETIDYPYFGDFNPPGRDSSLTAKTMVKNGGVGDLSSDEIYPHFGNELGYWGITYPTKALEAQPGRFCLLQAPGEGVYIGVEDPAYRLQYTFEQHPGVVSTVTGLVPPSDEISGIPVHLEFRACHFVFAPPHSATQLAPIVVRCYQGDWHAGLDINKQLHPAPGR